MNDGVGSIISFVLLSLLVIGMAWLTSRLLGRRMGGAGRSQHVHQVGALPLGRDRSILLVAVNDEVLVVGSTPHSITLLEKYPASAFPTALDRGGGGGGAPAGFQQALHKLMQRGEGRQRAGPEDGDDLRRRLQRLKGAARDRGAEGDRE